MQHCTASKYTSTSILFHLRCWYRLLYVCGTESSEGAGSINMKSEAEFWDVTLYSWADL
jgi:hypothetical protein